MVQAPQMALVEERKEFGNEEKRTRGKTGEYEGRKWEAGQLEKNRPRWRCRVRIGRLERELIVV